MNLLAIETATEACSAALMIGDQIRLEYAVEPQGHSRLILGMIESLLDQAGLVRGDIDAIAFGRGPGAFTGVRIGTGVVQGLAFALDIPVVPVSTLAALAEPIEPPDSAAILAAIDARMGELYWGGFRRTPSGLVPIIDESVGPAADRMLPESGPVIGVGTGWGVAADTLSERLGDRLLASQPEALPSADAIARLAMPRLQVGGGVSAEQALPVYLRDNVAKKAGGKA